MDPALLHGLNRLLHRQPGVWNELDLMNCLDRNPDIAFQKPVMTHTWALFQAHFWLYHHLYLLDQQWRQEGWCLVIRGPQIRPEALPTETGQPVCAGLPDRPDPLAAYYLDLTNLDAETPDSLNDMMTDFWRGVRGQGTGGMREAWATLGLPADSDALTLRRQYRRLCQRHHPDRGGDLATFQAIQAAYSQLRGRARQV